MLTSERTVLVANDMALDPPAARCLHPALVREGGAVRCDACAATALVPRCLGCRERTCPGCDDRACPSCQGKPTTWIVRPPHLVCYKCGRGVAGLA